MPSTRAIAALFAVVAATAAAATASGESGSSRPAGASATAYARQDPSGAQRGAVSVKRDGVRSGEGTRVTAATRRGRGSATASAAASGVDIFDGLVTAQSVRVRADAADGSTSTAGSVSGLAIEGTPADPPAGRSTYDLNGYGRLVALESGRTGIVGLSARLTKAYKGHAPGDVVRIAYASAVASDAVRAAAPAPRAAKPVEKPKKKRKPRSQRAEREPSAERALRQRREQEIEALLGVPGFAFPVAGKHSFSDEWGAPRQNTGQHEGNDIFAEFGTPVVAVADGRLYRVGTRKVPGNRLWLRNRQGHRFFYAHLSDFAASAFNGADVQAGEVIAFVGSTGDAEQTPPHVHFEAHARDGLAVNPFRLLTKWEAGGVGSAYRKDPGTRPGALIVVRDFLAEP